MTAAEILSIGEGEALSLFPGNAKDIKKRYHELARAWHPDVCADKKAAAVLVHINRLHEIAVGKALPSIKKAFRQGRTWVLNGGGRLNVCPLMTHKSSLGDVLVTSKTIAYETVTGYEDIAEDELSRVKAFKFANPDMEKSLKRFLPSLVREVDAVGCRVNIFERPADTVLLVDLVRHLKGRIPPVHAAWLISCLENMACYIQWMGLSHGGLSSENILVCPEMHSIILVGGWGYATPLGKRPKALPGRTLSLVPRLAVKGEVVDPTLDLTLIRAVGLEILGASGAGGLSMMKDVPTAMKTWLSMPPRANAIQDYKSWEECLIESFGPRKFVKMNVNPADIYSAL